MKNVILKPLFHRRQECIGIYFEKDALVQLAIQKAAKAKWSKTYKCWYVTCTGENYIRLKSALENIAELEITELKKFLLEKKKDSPIPSVHFEKKSAKRMAINPSIVASTKITQVSVCSHSLSKENTEALQQFKRELVLKGYSQSTQRTYENEFRQFLQTIKDTPAKNFSVSRLKDYFEYCYSKLKLSENTMHSRINALKFYYEQVYPVGLKKYWNVLLCVCITK